jgi:hypothetical protein
MRNSNLLIWTVGLALCFGLGCTGSRVADHMGEALHANNTQMIVDANASQRESDGVVEFEGTTVEGTMHRYRRTQKKAPSKVLPGSMLNQGVSGKAN